MFSIDLVKKNQVWRSSPAAREWSQFLSLFTQKNPMCSRHPDVELKREWKKNEKGEWEGTLQCTEESKPFGYIWPSVYPLYDWVGKTEVELLEEQKSMSRQIRSRREKQIEEIADFYISGKTGVPSLSKELNEELDTDKLYEKEDAWKQWMDFEDFHAGAQEKTLDQAVHFRIQLIQKGHLRDQYWEEFQTLAKDHLNKWVPWLEHHTWQILNHEGMPVPKRLEQIQKESPEIPLNVLEKWFRWSEASMDYLSILVKEQEFQQDLIGEQERELQIIDNFYFKFPEKLGGNVELTGTVNVIPATGGFLGLSENESENEEDTGELADTIESDIPHIGEMTPQEQADPGNNEHAQENLMQEEEFSESAEENREEGWNNSNMENVEGGQKEDLNEFVNNEQEVEERNNDE